MVCHHLRRIDIAQPFGDDLGDRLSVSADLNELHIVAAARLDEDEKNTLSLGKGIRSGRGNPNVIVISEAGLYRLRMQASDDDEVVSAPWIPLVVRSRPLGSVAYAASRRLRRSTLWRHGWKRADLADLARGSLPNNHLDDAAFTRGAAHLIANPRRPIAAVWGVPNQVRAGCTAQTPGSHGRSVVNQRFGVIPVLSRPFLNTGSSAVIH
jgi:hypothetical protein